MNRHLLLLTAALGYASLVLPASAAPVVTVVDLGTIDNDSISFPGTKTPGSSKLFADYFEFYIPEDEFLTASVSLSGPTVDQIPTGMGFIALYHWTSTGSSSPHIPAGALIEKAIIISSPSSGGQAATVGTQTLFGDLEPTGYYFVEVAGKSGPGALKLAIDGNVTAVPEASTWAMMTLGFAGLGLAATRRPKKMPPATLA